jgi:predicted nuclease of predicted toxin-antitoxin system
VTLAFLLDEDVSPRVADGLLRQGIDAQTVRGLGLANLRTPDEAILEQATAAGRVLVTYNRSDFQALDARWRAERRTHAGILWCTEEIVPRRDVGTLIRAILHAAELYDSLTGLCLPLALPLTRP